MLNSDKSFCIPLLVDETLKLKNCQRLDKMGTKCLECKSTYYLNKNWECVKFYDPNCLEFGPQGCAVCAENTVKIFTSNIANEFSQCQPISEFNITNIIENCTKYDIYERCLKCGDGFSLNFDNLSCLPILNCTYFDSRTNECLSCEHSYYKNSYGGCSKGNIDNCLVYENEFQCFICEDGYLKKIFQDEHYNRNFVRCIVMTSIGI